MYINLRVLYIEFTRVDIERWHTRVCDGILLVEMWSTSRLFCERWPIFFRPNYLKSFYLTRFLMPCYVGYKRFSDSVRAPRIKIIQSTTSWQYSRSPRAIIFLYNGYLSSARVFVYVRGNHLFDIHVRPNTLEIYDIILTTGRNSYWARSMVI